MKRSKGFWQKNEKAVMKKLGLEPVPMSGAGIRKEDGENEHILCQLKSTDKNQYTLKLQDIDTLIFHAEDIGKIPLFAIQFTSGTTLLCTTVEHIADVGEYLKVGKFKPTEKLQIESTSKISAKKLIEDELDLQDILKSIRTKL